MAIALLCNQIHSYIFVGGHNLMFPYSFPLQKPLKSHLKWTSASDNEIQTSSRYGSLSGDMLT